MVEFDPTQLPDAPETHEAAYRDALLGDDAGREARRARLMAALPRPEPAAAAPVARDLLAWRWQPYVLGLLATVLVLAAALWLRGRPAEPVTPDPRLAAREIASAPVVVAQAEPPVQSTPPPAAEAPRAAAKVSPAKPRETRRAEAVVVADAAMPRAVRDSDVAGVVVAEPAAPAHVPPPPAAPVVAAAPAPMPMDVMPAAPPPLAAMQSAPKALAESAAPSASSRADLARQSVTVAGARARAPQIAQSLAASDAFGSMAAATAADTALLAAVNRADLAATRTALEAGANTQLRDAQGRTVLMLAARRGARDVVDLLLIAGARKADVDPRGWTAADHAESQGHGELVMLLR
jgi:hypothetical protein